MTTQSRSTLSAWSWLATLVAGGIGIALFTALEPASIPQSAVYDVVGLAMVGIAFAGIAVRRPTARQPWLLMAAGQLAFVVGDVIWTVFDAIGIEPFPSLADVAYLLGYPLLSLGLIVAIRRRTRGGDRAGLLDAAILATGAAVVWWSFVLGPLAANADPDPLSFAISVAYPIGDLLLIGMAMALAMTPGARSRSFGLLCTSLVVLLVGDLVFGLQSLAGTYVDGGPLDAVWLAVYALFAAAAVHPSMVELGDARPVTVSLLGPVRLLLLAASMFVGPGLLLARPSQSDPVVVVVATASALLSVLILARLFGMVRLLARDIERRQVLEDQLSYQAYHDPLTGLANRRRFISTVADVLSRPGGAAALFLDLDDFKDVNDAMGHDAGDELLAMIGRRLAGAVRPGDLVSRLGGDEFAVLLPGTASTVDAGAVAGRLLDALAAPFEVEGVPLRTSASIGVAVVPPDVDSSVDGLLREADVAMYHAKARGKGQVAAYAADLEPGGAPGILLRRGAPAA